MCPHLFTLVTKGGLLESPQIGVEGSIRVGVEENSSIQIQQVDSSYSKKAWSY